MRFVLALVAFTLAVVVLESGVDAAPAPPIEPFMVGDPIPEIQIYIEKLDVLDDDLATMEDKLTVLEGKADTFVKARKALQAFFVDFDKLGAGAKSGAGAGTHMDTKGDRCFDETTTIWRKNETLSDDFAEQVMLKDLREGDLVKTVDMNPRNPGDSKFIWTRATDVKTYTGNWEAHSFGFGNGHKLTATSPHMMIIWKHGVPYLVRADQVQLGDLMKMGEMITSVTSIQNHSIKTKVAIQTEDGTVQVNGVLAASVCDNNPDAFDRIMKLETTLENWKNSHFGEDYNTMCMDSVAWKNAYNRINPIPANVPKMGHVFERSYLLEL